MNEGKDSYPFLWIYRPHKVELGTLITTQLQGLLNSFWKQFQTAYLRCEFALVGLERKYLHGPLIVAVSSYN